jgi:hypothetical protein
MNNDRRVISAVAYIDNALRYIDKKGYTSAWCRDRAVYALKTARTLLQNTKDEQKEDRDLSRLFVQIQKLVERKNDKTRVI